ncbi:hypothetical protein MKX01_025056 [Papaver californicum]|nr:hypothetical protein MKX01_025056 [Papaver californicum]
MPTVSVWFALKRSLHCKSNPSDVHDPKVKNHLKTISTRRICGKSGCSRSIANLKDVIHGSKTHLDRPPSCSPRSIGSNEFMNPITHEVILSNSKCELKITSFNGGHRESGGSGSSTFVGTLSPGTPGPGGVDFTMHYQTPSFRSSITPPRKSHGFLLDNKEGSSGFGNSSDNLGGAGNNSNHRASYDFYSSNGCTSSTVTCLKCGVQYGELEAAETHHLSKHAVTELVEGDSSRKIVEIICRTSWLKSENNCGRIERVLKVHNMQKTVARFEEYREMVKMKASKLSKKHPRCLADGNELLRFYGTTVECSLGTSGSSSLCVSEKCSVCRILRHGFSTKSEPKVGIGIFTASTSETAFETIEPDKENAHSKKALIVCRVIAGRVHKPLENFQELVGQTGFDSLAGKMGVYSNIEELYLLNPKALLPCFVVICKS